MHKVVKEVLVISFFIPFICWLLTLFRFSFELVLFPVILYGKQLRFYCVLVQAVFALYKPWCGVDFGEQKLAKHSFSLWLLEIYVERLGSFWRTKAQMFVIDFLTEWMTCWSFSVMKCSSNASSVSCSSYALGDFPPSISSVLSIVLLVNWIGFSATLLFIPLLRWLVSLRSL